VSKLSLLTRLKIFLSSSDERSAESVQSVDRRAAAEAAPLAANLGFSFQDERIPSASKPKIETIFGLLSEIEDQAKLTSAGRDALDEARRIKKIYLPEMMNSYFVIPAAHRAEIFRKTGKSASFQLNDRLDKIVYELRSISSSFAAGQIDNFTINLKFIDKKFTDENDQGPAF